MMKRWMPIIRKLPAPAFQVLQSKWGYHITPLMVHDSNGVFVAATSLLDNFDLCTCRRTHRRSDHLTAPLYSGKRSYRDGHGRQRCHFRARAL